MTVSQHFGLKRKQNTLTSSGSWLEILLHGTSQERCHQTPSSNMKTSDYIMNLWPKNVHSLPSMAFKSFFANIERNLLQKNKKVDFVHSRKGSWLTKKLTRCLLKEALDAIFTFLGRRSSNGACGCDRKNPLSGARMQMLQTRPATLSADCPFSHDILLFDLIVVV